jgi:hypothetical protein
VRVAAGGLALLGALVSLYVPLDAYRNGLNSGFPTPPAFFVIGVAFAVVGLAGGAFIWRRPRLGLWLLLAAALGGLAVWPWLSAGMVYLLAAVVSVVSLRMARGQTRPTT